MGGREHLGQATRRWPVQRLRHLHQLALVHHGQLRLRPAADDRHHALAEREALGARPERRDLAGELHAGDVGRPSRRGGIETAQLRDVAPVQASRAHAHQHLAGAGDRIGMLLDAQLVLADGGGAHGGTPYPPIAGERTRGP